MGDLRKPINDGTDSRITFRQRETSDKVEGDMGPWVTGIRQWEEKARRGLLLFLF